jgi:signal transduction histidine kinase
VLRKSPMSIARLLISARSKRMIGIYLACVLFVFVLVYEALHDARIPSAHATGAAVWAWYAGYSFIGLLFFGVGTLVWLYSYARQRVIATLLCCFCCLVTFAFAALCGAPTPDGFTEALGSGTSGLAVLCLFLLLLRFPRNLLELSPRFAGRRVFFLLVQAAVGCLCLLTVSYSLLTNLFAAQLPQWWYSLGISYYGVTTLGVMLLIALAARTTTSVRQLQQTRLFFVGTLLAVVPILILTVVPALLHLSIHIDGTQSMVFLIFFPLSTGYSLLRYELLVFDLYVRRAVTWVIGAVSLALLGYFLFAVGSQVAGTNVSLVLSVLIGAGVLGAPVIWRFAHRLTERVFFPETLYYQTRLKESLTRRGLEAFDLQLAVHQLVLDVITTLRSPEACVFVLDDDTQTFGLMRLPQRETRGDQGLTDLLTHLHPLFSPSQQESAASIAGMHPAIARLDASSRPLFLSELDDGATSRSAGIGRYLKRPRARGAAPDPLLAPVRAPHGHLIGLVVVGERGDQQMYAGPELEALQHLIDGAAPAVETARLYELAMRQQAESRRELEQAYEQQRQLNEQKDQFIIHVSHELRTPLSEVTGYLDMLAEAGEELDSEMRALFVQKAQHGSDELMKLVLSILDAAQSSFASPLPLHMEAVALSAILQEVIEHLDPQAARDHAIEVQVAPETWVYADAHALQLILANLVSNALKYTPTGTPIFVRAVPERDGDADEPLMCIQVKDEGPGIPPSEAPLLFGKFARLQRDLNGSIRGTGLGLYINKQLVESMGGHIWVESSGVEGEGSLFTFTLRRAEVSPAPERSVEGVLV